jgi:serine/threonine protein kinase
MAKRPSLFTEVERFNGPKINLGEWCLHRGWITPAQLEACLQIQRERMKAGGPAPRLGEIFVERRILTPQQVVEALADQLQEIRVCGSCGIRVNVPRRADASSYKCPRCQGVLVPSKPDDGLDVIDEAAIVVSQEPLPPDVEKAGADPANRFGKYILLGEAGRGGTGAVYRAWDTLLHQVVALKRLAPADGDEPTPLFTARAQSLLKEARHSIRLRHPGIVSVFDVGVIGTDYYISMEFLEAESLYDRLEEARKRGRPSPYYDKPREVLRTLAEVARAVHYAHTRPAPIIHCDLKPANILVDRDGHAHIVDFGIARNLKTESPEENEIRGTPSYMAPEQCSGESNLIDARTDVYGFGAVLYEMLAGRAPFVGVPLEILERTMRQEPEPPTRAVRDTDIIRRPPGEYSTQKLLRIPPELEEICLQCLRKAREDRPASLLKVAEVLDRAAGAASASAIPAQKVAPSPARRLLLVAALVATAAASGAAILLRPDPSAVAEREIFERLAEFHPETALPLAEDLRARGTLDPSRAALLVEEAGWVSRLKERLIGAGTPAAAVLVDVRLRAGSRGPAQVVGAGLASLRVTDGKTVVEFPWKDLHPDMVPMLVDRLLGTPEPSDRLAAAIVCLRAGEKKTAGAIFTDLRSGPLKIVAERYLDLVR